MSHRHRHCCCEDRCCCRPVSRCENRCENSCGCGNNFGTGCGNNSIWLILLLLGCGGSGFGGFGF